MQILIGDGVVVNRGTYCRRHVLPAWESVEGCIRLEADAANGRVQLLEAPRGADKRAARSECGHEMCDAASGLLPDFAGRGAVVRLPVGRVAVLIGIKIFLRLGRHDLVNPANSAVGALIARRNDPPPAKRTEDAFVLGGGTARKGQFYAINKR